MKDLVDLSICERSTGSRMLRIGKWCLRRETNLQRQIPMLLMARSFVLLLVTLNTSRYQLEPNAQSASSPLLQYYAQQWLHQPAMLPPCDMCQSSRRTNNMSFGIGITLANLINTHSGRHPNTMTCPPGKKTRRPKQREVYQGSWRLACETRR
jgi:hypothetical protein